MCPSHPLGAYGALSLPSDLVMPGCWDPGDIFHGHSKNYEGPAGRGAHHDRASSQPGLWVAPALVSPGLWVAPALVGPGLWVAPALVGPGLWVVPTLGSSFECQTGKLAPLGRATTVELFIPRAQLRAGQVLDRTGRIEKPPLTA